jgi:2-(1,2-epoxy-1,2-dihydrophenyl)acetyl-CoA isomerase
MSDYKVLLAAESEGVLTVTLNRPDRLNALTDELMTALLGAFKCAALSASVRCVVLTGAGSGFCAGQDLAAPPPGNQVSLRDHMRAAHIPLLLAMEALEKPVVAAINGACVGAGLALALSCDLRLAAQTATFRAGFIGIGLAPDCGASYWLPRLIGPAHAAEMLFTNDRMDAQTAEHLGLVSRVLPAAELAAAAHTLAVRLAAGPALALTKRALKHALQSTFADTLEYEAHLQDAAGRSPDFVEGVSAFIQKRKPQYIGT